MSERPGCMPLRIMGLGPETFPLAPAKITSPWKSQGNLGMGFRPGRAQNLERIQQPVISSFLSTCESLDSPSALCVPQSSDCKKDSGLISAFIFPSPCQYTAI